MTTVGYGDITPGRTIEYVLAGIIMLMGASLYAFIIGSIASLLNSINAAKNRHWERIESVTEFLRDQKVSADLNSEVRNFYEHIWERYRGVDRNRMLDDLPPPLRLKVLLHLTEEIRQTVPLFRHAAACCAMHYLQASSPGPTRPAASLRMKETVERASSSSRKVPWR